MIQSRRFYRIKESAITLKEKLQIANLKCVKLEEENNLLGKELRKNTLEFSRYIFKSSKHCLDSK